MKGKNHKPARQLRNIVLADENRLDGLIAQIPNAFSILENAKFGFSFRGASVDLKTNLTSCQTVIRKIRRVETFLARNSLINKARPRKMPPSLPNGPGYWWVKETFKARKIIIPTPVLLDKFGILALAIWVSDPKRISKPRKPYEWSGSFLYLPTVHFHGGTICNVISGCSALQFLINATENMNLYQRNPNEPFGRGSREHPIEKLRKIGGFVSDERLLESLYFVRYITDEQSYVHNDVPTRVNDIVGYPLYISAYPPTGRNVRSQVSQISDTTEGLDSPLDGDFEHGQAEET